MYDPDKSADIFCTRGPFLLGVHLFLELFPPVYLKIIKFVASEL